MKKLISIFILLTIFLSGCNSKSNSSEDIKIDETPSSTIEVLSKAINEIDAKTALSCMEISSKDKEVIIEKVDEIQKNQLFKALYQSAVYTSVKEVTKEEINGDNAIVDAIISIETIKNLGETAKNIVIKIVKEGSNYNQDELQSLVLNEVSKIDINKKEVVNIGMTFNMKLIDGKWVIILENGVQINENSISIKDEE